MCRYGKEMTGSAVRARMAKADELMVRYERGEPAPPVISHPVLGNPYFPLPPQVARISAIVRPQLLPKKKSAKKFSKLPPKYPPSPEDNTSMEPEVEKSPGQNSRKISDPDIQMIEEKSPEIITISPETTPPSTEDEDEFPASKYSYEHEQIEFTLRCDKKKKNKYQKLVKVIQQDDDIQGVELVTLAGETGVPGPSSKKMFGVKLRKPRPSNYKTHLNNILDTMLQSNARDLVEIPQALRFPLNQGPFMLLEASLILGSAFFPARSGVLDMCVNNLTASMGCNMSQQELADVEQAVLFSGAALDLVATCRKVMKTRKKKNKHPETKIDVMGDQLLTDAQHGLDTVYVHAIVRRRREILDECYPIEDKIYRMTQGFSSNPVLFE